MPFVGVESLYELPILDEVRLSPDGAAAAVVHSQADPASDDYRREICVYAVERGRSTGPLAQLAGDLPRWAPDGSGLLLRRRAPTTGVWCWRRGADEPELMIALTGVLDVEWSPTGEEVAVLRADGSDTAPVAVGRPTVGGELVVFDRNGRQPRRLEGGANGVTGFAWSPDGSSLALVGGATQDAPWLSVVARDGVRARPLAHGLATIESVAWMPAGESLLLAGKTVRDSAAHVALHLLELGTGKLQRLAAGLDRNVMVGAPGYPGVRPQPTAGGDGVVFAARDRGAVHLLRAPLHGDSLVELVIGADRVVSSASLAGDRIAAVVARDDTPGELAVLRADGSGQLLWLTDGGMRAVAGSARPEEFVVEATDGLAVHGWVLRSESAHQQPLLLDIHGGPHNAFAPAFSDIYLYRYELLARGWSVAFCNPRGSDGYGAEYRRALRCGWGVADEHDLLAVLDALVADGTADPARIAVTGYSYGGYMTQWLTARTSRFAAAVVGGGISDLITCHANSTESELFESEFCGTPTSAADLYRRLSPLRYAEDVRTPTLLLHGTADRSCPPGQAEAWFAALQQRSVPSELVLYPGAGHLFIVNGRPSHRVDYGHRIVNWLTDRVPARAAGQPRAAIHS